MATLGQLQVVLTACREEGVFDRKDGDKAILRTFSAPLPMSRNAAAACCDIALQVWQMHHAEAKP